MHQVELSVPNRVDKIVIKKYKGRKGIFFEARYYKQGKLYKKTKSTKELINQAGARE